MGIFYPDSNDTFDPFHDCPSFWHDKKIKINPMNFTSEEYMSNIQTAAYIGMALNTAVIVAYLFSFKGIIMSEPGCDKLKLFIKIAYGFFWCFADSISGNMLISVELCLKSLLYKYKEWLP